ncbi:hypothetical protein ATE84_2238 [Aquimarina sp. MAR_2010_214]|uniref:hypothetical protein n=1 Tax=Aquimarina sp. MAR_2010_214 TaxID=1250026 RepID=UPI000C713B45|nr:hypothetical protein [Aquimarina sp. MAR_2010_214]PKV50188.1 hypothetical protein ATE84_2238 [Aquimarina sp. MAR_2010_214]
MKQIFHPFLKGKTIMLFLFSFLFVFSSQAQIKHLISYINSWGSNSNRVDYDYLAHITYPFTLTGYFKRQII